MKTKILSILRESRGYVSGQQLCEEFQVSRTAVWKVMEQLKKEGYQIEAVRNKGYMLKEAPDIMSKAEIQSLLQTKWAARQVFYFDAVDSTNIMAKMLGEEGKSHGTLVAADRQTRGKGRRGRGWSSPAGENIYASILLRPSFPPSTAPMLTLVMAISVVDAVREITGLAGQIKWPNDVLVNGKKVCGILTEMSAEVDYINHVVIGFGINTNTKAFPEEIKETATSLLLEGGAAFGRAMLIAAVMRHFETNYEVFLETGDVSKLQEHYNALLINKGREVRIIGRGESWNGCALGINRTGELLVEKEGGQVEEIFAGEVSVRGVYGYV